MPIEYFLDTNILIYAASRKSREPIKGPMAQALLTQEDLGTSGQVLAEFYWNATNGRAKCMDPPEAAAWVDRLAKMPCADVDKRLVRSAITLSLRYRIAYWDAAILVAAERLGAKVVDTEDLNHGQTYGSVRVENPFL